MLSLAQIIKDLSAKAKTIMNNISDAYLNSLITKEIERSTTSSTDGPLYTAIKNAAFTNLPPKIGYGKEKTLNMSSAGGLQVQVAEQAIYLGGFGTVIPAQKITLKPNINNYIYVARDAADYSKVNFEIYDHLLGGKDKDIHFSRILCARYTTNASSITGQEKFETANYSCF